MCEGDVAIAGISVIKFWVFFSTVGRYQLVSIWHWPARRINRCNATFVQQR